MHAPHGDAAARPFSKLERRPKECCEAGRCVHKGRGIYLRRSRDKLRTTTNMLMKEDVVAAKRFTQGWAVLQIHGFAAVEDPARPASGVIEEGARPSGDREVDVTLLHLSRLSKSPWQPRFTILEPSDHPVPRDCLPLRAALDASRPRYVGRWDALEFLDISKAQFLTCYMLEDSEWPLVQVRTRYVCVREWLPTISIWLGLEAEQQQWAPKRLRGHGGDPGRRRYDHRCESSSSSSSDSSFEGGSRGSTARKKEKRGGEAPAHDGAIDDGNQGDDFPDHQSKGGLSDDPLHELGRLLEAHEKPDIVSVLQQLRLMGDVVGPRLAGRPRPLASCIGDVLPKSNSQAGSQALPFGSIVRVYFSGFRRIEGIALGWGYPPGYHFCSSVTPVSHVARSSKHMAHSSDVRGRPKVVERITSGADCEVPQNDYH
jgi:hypothetical protein